MLKLKIMTDSGDELYSQCLMNYMWLICYFYPFLFLIFVIKAAHQ